MTWVTSPRFAWSRISPSSIGENLIACTYNSLRSRNFNLLSLTVTEMNGRAVDLYKRLGFVQMSVFDAFVWEG